MGRKKYKSPVIAHKQFSGIHYDFMTESRNILNTTLNHGTRLTVKDTLLPKAENASRVQYFKPKTS